MSRRPRPAASANMTDIEWCAAMADALDRAAAMPSLDRVGEVKALVAITPAQMVTGEWQDLRAAAREWLARVDRLCGAFELLKAEAAVLDARWLEVSGLAAQRRAEAECLGSEADVIRARHDAVLAALVPLERIAA